MSNIIPINSNVPAALQSAVADMDMSDDLSAGIKGSYGVISIRGGTWKIKFGGDEEAVLNEDGDPKPGLEVVIVKASPNISKIFYEGAWTEGSDAEPDCYSNDGITPAADAANPQATSCAACPQNVWGSRITENNKKAKACADSRRVAVAPADDIANEVMGGPMLLRVPAASLKDLATFGKAVAQKGVPYCAIVTRLSFDPEAAYPKLRYKAVRVLDNDEGQMVADHLANKAVLDTVLGLAPVTAPEPTTTKEPESEEEATVDADFEVPPEKPKKASPKKKAAPKKKAEAKKEDKKAEEATGAGESVDDDDLDGLLDGLDL